MDTENNDVIGYMDTEDNDVIRCIRILRALRRYSLYECRALDSNAIDYRDSKAGVGVWVNDVRN